jgi:hypothetical protein
MEQVAVIDADIASLDAIIAAPTLCSAPPVVVASAERLVAVYVELA